MKLLITGATGFVGKTLVPFLYTNGITNICLLVRDVPKARGLFSGVPISIIDTNMCCWRNQVIDFNPDIVIHMATCFTGKSEHDFISDIIDTNVKFTTYLLEAISHTTCRYFINIGTFSEYLYNDDRYFANNLYSASKTAVRPIIQFYQTQGNWHWINVIIYSPYGRYNNQKKVIDYLYSALDSDVALNFTQGEQILDFIHVDDIAAFFLSLLDQIDIFNKPYCQLYLGTGVGHSIREVASVMEKITSKKINANWGALPYRMYDTMLAIAPTEKNILSWHATISLEDGLAIYCQEMAKAK